MSRPPQDAASDSRPLSSRQGEVLRAVVGSWVGHAQPVASETIAQLLPVAWSPATVRSTLAELAELGLVTKPHASAGRFPTQSGLRFYVRHLLGPRRLGSDEMRDLAAHVEDGDPQEVLRSASRVLSERTRQLGFVVAPRLDRVVLRHVSLVRLASERVLVLLVSQTGVAHQRVIADEGSGDQAELDRVAAELNGRVAGRTLSEVHALLSQEAKALRRHANRLLSRVVALGLRALASPEPAEPDVVIETRLALLAQPEFQDPRRLRDVLAAVETKERLLELLDKALDGDGVSVAFGEELEEPALHDCALVASRYGGPGAPLGVLGVIGPSRMNYARVIPLVRYLSEVITGKLCA